MTDSLILVVSGVVVVGCGLRFAEKEHTTRGTRAEYCTTAVRVVIAAVAAAAAMRTCLRAIARRIARIEVTGDFSE